MPRVPTQLRASSFQGAEGLQAPSNDLLSDVQERLNALERRQEIALLGPLPVTLPIDGFVAPPTAVDFSTPGWTPTKVFVVALEAADAPGTPVIQPSGLEVQIEGARVRVMRLTTTTSTAYKYLLTLGAIRG